LHSSGHHAGPPARNQLRKLSLVFSKAPTFALPRESAIGLLAMTKNPIKRIRRQKKVTWPQAKAFSVHLLTASGSFLAFLSVVAASEQRWAAMFWWLGLALFVDGIDGPIARRLQVKLVLPNWSGDTLDNIIDYVTYVLIPAFALYQRGFMGTGLSFLSAAIIVVTSAIYYADTGMKTKENFFKGFPVVWNMLVFTLFIAEPGEWVAFGIVVATAVFTFLPINFLHPVRVKRLRTLNLACFLLWCAFGAIALFLAWGAPPASPMHAPSWVKAGIALTSLYLFCIGAVMQYFPNLGRKEA
jgi:phosphatidylcholine synthase